MPMYEYICEACDHHFELMQSLNTKADETTCPRCQALKSRRIMSSFSSKVIGDHKTGFAEMKGYDMLNERMNKFAKLPPAVGQRAAPDPSNLYPPGSESGDGGV